MTNRLFQWDPEHLVKLTSAALDNAKKDHEHYLGEGSPLTIPAAVYFMRLKELAIQLGKTAGALSPSVRALGGIVPVSLLE